MRVEQIYTGCLAQGAYYIESKGEAAVIDPLREITPYLEKAKKNNARIKYVLETHFHADFVSGHIDLAKATGATIVYGPNARPTFEAHIAGDGDELKIGNLTIKVLHTPGHTLESTTYLLQDKQGKDHAIFTGDTLFIGDVGRPDLAAKSILTQEDLAAILYDSLQSRIMPLADDVIVYPAHGAGSACGKNMSKETYDTLGHQKQTNYALRTGLTKEQFVKEVTYGLLPPPAYFPINVQMNKEGYEGMDEVLKRGLQALHPDAFEAAANETGALILDTRKPEVFAAGFIPNSINIGIDGSFAPWVGTLVPDVKQPLLLITDQDREEEVVTRLARVGYDSAIGYLDGGFETWKKSGKETDAIESISAVELAGRLQKTALKVVDVRKPAEYETGHMGGATNVPLVYINDHMAALNKDHTLYLYCAGGYRSMITASILKARGFDKLVNVEGGFKAIAAADIPCTADTYTCKSGK
jgi:glyoxylase-like metal-dependent hydrolase (beta-lactamase superfamily II)/rhodanese-related sulfurtransferase